MGLWLRVNYTYIHSGWFVRLMGHNVDLSHYDLHEKPYCCTERQCSASFCQRKPLISSLLLTLRSVRVCVCVPACVCVSLISEQELGAVDEMSGKPVSDWGGSYMWPHPEGIVGEKCVASLMDFTVLLQPFSMKGEKKDHFITLDPAEFGCLSALNLPIYHNVRSSSD